MKETILITGGAGYIGTACTTALLDAGYLVIVYDNLNSGKRELVDPRAEFHNGDILDAQSLESVFEKYSIDHVFHFAALKAVGESEQNPSEYYKTNVTGTLNILESMKKFHIPSIFFSSTAAVYKPNESGIYTEESELAASSVYGSTKKICEELISQYQRLGFLRKSVVYRFFNLAGDVGLSFVDDQPQNVFPLLAKAITHASPFSIFGDDYSTRDGTGIRDYIHLSDLVAAHLLALEKNVSGVFNLGTSIGTTVSELVTSFELETGQKMSVQKTSRRAGDVPQAIADSTHAQTVLGWIPKKTLQDMVTSTLKTYGQKNKG